MARTAETEKTLEKYTIIVQERVASFAYAGRSTSLQFTNTHNTREKQVPTPATKKGLMALNKRIIQAQLKVLACDRRWKNLLLRVKLLEV